MRRPAFQFYTGDWQGNAKLRRCSHAEKGTWIDTLCLMHDSEEEYGVLRWPLKDVAKAVGCRLTELVGLRQKGVLKGADVGERCEAFIYTPRHAGRDGEPVALIPEQDGPIWFSSRMVRDEHIRAKRGAASRFESDTDAIPKHTPDSPPNPTFGAGKGDGSTISSSASPNTLSTTPVVDGAHAPPDCPHDRLIELYHELMPTSPRVLTWNDTRRGHMRARWREKAKPNGRSQGYATVDDGLAYWRRFFAWCNESKFLTGRAESQPGKPPFVANLAWLIKPENFAKTLEGNYHR